MFINKEYFVRGMRSTIPTITALLALLDAGTALSEERFRTQLLESTGDAAQLVLTAEQIREGKDPTEVTYVLVDNKGKPDDVLDAVSGPEELKGKKAENKYGEVYRSERDQTLAHYVSGFFDLANRQKDSSLGGGNVRIYQLGKISDIPSPEDRKRVREIADEYTTPFNSPGNRTFKLIMAEEYDGTEYFALGYSDRTIWFHVAESNRVDQDTVINLSEPRDSTKSAMSGLVNTFLTLYRGRSEAPQTKTEVTPGLDLNPQL